MVTAALVSFAILLIAWIAAPDHPRAAAAAEVMTAEAEPIAA